MSIQNGNIMHIKLNNIILQIILMYDICFLSKIFFCFFFFFTFSVNFNDTMINAYFYDPLPPPPKKMLLDIWTPVYVQYILTIENTKCYKMLNTIFQKVFNCLPVQNIKVKCKTFYLIKPNYQIGLWMLQNIFILSFDQLTCFWSLIFRPE